MKVKSLIFLLMGVIMPVNIVWSQFSLIEKGGLNTILDENSGILYFEGSYITHNDSGGASALYILDTINLNIQKTITLTGVENIDWEDLTQDETHLYVGDFGNNRGTRRDLRILKIAKSDFKTLTSITPQIISFSYQDQQDFEINEETDYDAEALITVGDHIIVFTKQWGSQNTTAYQIPKTIGNHLAIPLSNYEVGGLITSATFNKEDDQLILLGYSNLLNPFIVKSTVFENLNFFNETTSKFTLPVATTQMEAVDFISQKKLILSCENFQRPPLIDSPARAFIILFPEDEFENPENPEEPPAEPNENAVFVYGNYNTGILEIAQNEQNPVHQVQIFDIAGKMVLSVSKPDTSIQSVDLNTLASGIYLIHLKTNTKTYQFKTQKL